MSNAAPEYTKPPLDESLYLTAEEDLAFIKEQTGIHDPETLKKHILEVQRKAYNLYGHHCIRSFAFTRTRVSTLPAYQAALTLGREREGAILLDLGCCFGTDIRKAASDGFPVQNLIASDLRPAFWNCGHELFQTNPETFPIKFLAGDAFDPAFLAPAEPLTFQNEVSTPAPPLASLTSLTPLCGHVSALHTSSVFHLFFEAQQLQFARALASLLCPAPGSVIFGAHTGRRAKGFNMGGYCSGGHHMFCHSPETFREMWGEVFKEGTVKIEVELTPRGRATDIHDFKSEDMGRLVWSVTRI